MRSEEQKRRKELLKNIRGQERDRAIAELPAPLPILRQLFHWVDMKMDACDNTLRITLEYIRQNNLDEARIVEWLNQYGGYCDCEVLTNVEDSNPALKS